MIVVKMTHSITITTHQLSEMHKRLRAFLTTSAALRSACRSLLDHKFRTCDPKFGLKCGTKDDIRVNRNFSKKELNTEAIAPQVS